MYVLINPSQHPNLKKRITSSEYYSLPWDRKKHYTNDDTNNSSFSSDSSDSLFSGFDNGDSSFGSDYSDSSFSGFDGGDTGGGGAGGDW
jgi:uncharacterized protein